MIQKLDAVFYCWFEQFAHWWQRLTGYTSYWLAKWCAAGVACLMVVLSSGYWFPEIWGDHPFGASKYLPGVMFMGWVFLRFGVYLFIRCEEEDIKSRSGFQNCLPGFVHLELSWPVVPGRTIGVLFMLTHYPLIPFSDNAMHTLALLLSHSWVLFYYFISVPPLPPGQSKLGQLKDKILAHMSMLVSKPAAAHL